MRKIAALVVITALFGAAEAQPDVQYGTMTLSFGKARRADGTVVDLKGMKLRVKVERIKTTRNFRPPSFFEPMPAPAPMAASALQTYYHADQDPNNTGLLPYGVIDPEFDSSSVLDDFVVNANAIGKIWSQLTWGFEAGNLNRHLFRWTLFTTYNSAAPNGTSAFGPWPILPTWMLDFGAIWPPIGIQATLGPVKVTAAGFEPAQISAPSTNFWMCQQIRNYVFPGNPDAPFDPQMKNIFNQSLPPQVGFSDIYYWLDSEPNGMYEEQEKDIFGEPSAPLQGNLLFRIEGNSTSTTQDALATGVQLEKGIFLSGDFSDLHFSDDFYYQARPDYALPRLVEPIQIKVIGRSPIPNGSNPANINSLSFNVESSVLGGSGTQKLQLYRFGGGSPGWVDVNTRTINSTDSNYTYVYTGANPEYFVNTADSNRMWARILITPGPDSGRVFTARVDRARWTVGIP